MKRKNKNIQLIVVALLISFAGYSQQQQSNETDKNGLLYSRIGYDLNSEKHIMVRSTSEGYIDGNTDFSIHDEVGKKVFAGKMYPWGEKWKNYWWVADFSGLNLEGNFTVVINARNGLKTKPFEIKEDLLWEDTWKTVSIEQLKGRVDLRNKNKTKHGPEHAEGGGWQDCGGYLREVNSHSTMLIGLFDLLEFSKDKIETNEIDELLYQIDIGLGYLAFCQDKARELGKGDGAIVHEWPKHRNVITGDVAKAALCFARAAYVLPEHRSKEDINEYLGRAERSFNWLDTNGPNHNPGGTNFHGTVLADDGFNRIAYGAPVGYQRPKEWKTRDAVMMTWIATELTKAGKNYKEKATQYARMLMARQIAIEKPEGRFYGHFRAYASSDFTEKAWEHHEMGYDAGATFPHYLIPLVQMARLWPDHPDAQSWDGAIRNFAYGYFLPACYDNPFQLLPMGYYKNEGLLTFSGLWHGMNGAYGSAAALALELEDYTEDVRFGKIATGNLQWIAGLNSGVFEEGVYTSKSMIYGIGDEFIGSWTKIPGTICNGFESDAQFIFTEPKEDTDGPSVFTDEGWITHSGGWLSAISRF